MASGTITSYDYAQTNIQLYHQLLGRGYDEAQLARVRSCYELAMKLHVTRFRASGRTFLSHLVCTASILAELDVNPDVVIAGLLHGVYGHGDFGDATRGVRPDKRSVVQLAAGDAAESRVFAYSQLGWSGAILRDVEDRFDTLGIIERDAVVIRLANELDDHLDLDILFCAGLENRLDYIATEAAGMVRLAERLDHLRLAAELKIAAEECGSGHVPEVLRSQRAHVFELVPDSYDLRWPLALSRRLERWMHRIASLPRAVVRRVRRSA